MTVVTIITDIRVPADAFPLGDLLQADPDIGIELERLIPMQQGVIPLIWVAGKSEAAIEETLRADPFVEDVVQLTRTPDRVLYSVTWRPDVDALVRTFVDLNVDVLSGEGTTDGWAFRLQFRNREGLQRFRRACRAHDIDLELVELFNPMMPPEKGPLTSEQKDVLATAYENGYWDVPRGITQEELAALMGVNDSLLSRRLRDAVKLAVGELLFGPGGKPFE